MPIDGGRLNAHNARIKDFRRRKDGKMKGSDVLRSASSEKVEFDSVDPIQLEKIKVAIRKKARKSRIINVILILISSSIAIVLFYLVTEKYS